MKNTDMKRYRARWFDALLGLFYVAAFICLIVLAGQRNAEIDKWIYEHERAREIMLQEEASVVIEPIELTMPIDLGSVAL